jgi:hypothetical protein
MDTFSFWGLPGGRAPHSTRFVRSPPAKGIFDGDDGQASLREGRGWEGLQCHAPQAHLGSAKLVVGGRGSAADLLPCLPWGVDPHKTVSPPSPGHKSAVSTVHLCPFSTFNPPGNPDSLIALVYGVRSSAVYGVSTLWDIHYGDRHTFIHLWGQVD